jgi:putative heme transporter
MRRLISGRGVLVFLAFGLIVYLAVGRFLGERAHLPAVDSSAFGLLVVALVAELAAKVVFGAMFKEAVRAGGLSLGLQDAVRAALVASGVARLIPAGGAFTPAAMAWTVRDRVAGTAGAALRTTVLTYGGLLTMTGAGILWIHAAGSGVFLQAGVVALGAAGVATGALLLSGPRWMGSLTRRLPERLRKLIGPTAVDRRVTFPEVGLLVVRLGSEVGAMVCTFAALGIPLTLAKGIVTFGVAHLIGGLPGSPGGLGVIEAGLVGVLALFGVSPSVSLGPVLVYRVIAYWIPAAIGVFAGAQAWVAHDRASGQQDADRA